eukprot:6197404-Pleurochrysis_carterae.AAC.1
MHDSSSCLRLVSSEISRLSSMCTSIIRSHPLDVVFLAIGRLKRQCTGMFVRSRLCYWHSSSLSMSGLKHASLWKAGRFQGMTFPRVCLALAYMITSKSFSSGNESVVA